MGEYAAFYIDYLYCFNIERNFFDCHEYGEHLWLDTGRPEFLKGMIQVAVSLYHLENGNLRGSRIMWQKASKYLEPYTPVYMGVDIQKIYMDMNHLHSLLPSVVEKTTIDEVENWDLPEVFIRIVDPYLEEALANWSLSALEED